MFRPIAVIGNPPFGKGGKLAIDFLNKSVFADYVAFILPASIEKDSCMKRIDRRLIPIYSMEIPLGSFECVGDRDWSRSPRCKFIIFRVGNRTDPFDRRALPQKPTSKLFEWTSDYNMANFVFKRNGGGCGTARFKTKQANQTLGGYYYVKCKPGIKAGDLFMLFNRDPFPSRDLAVSSKSISQDEAMREINRRYEKYGLDWTK
jgi:hypothetical protein